MGRGTRKGEGGKEEREKEKSGNKAFVNEGKEGLKAEEKEIREKKKDLSCQVQIPMKDVLTVCKAHQ